MGEESGWGRRIHTSGSVASTAISSQRMAVLPQNAPNIYDSHTIRGLDKSKDQINIFLSSRSSSECPIANKNALRSDTIFSVHY